MKKLLLYCLISINICAMDTYQNKNQGENSDINLTISTHRGAHLTLNLNEVEANESLLTEQEKEDAAQWSLRVQFGSDHNRHRYIDCIKKILPTFPTDTLQTVRQLSTSREETNGEGKKFAHEIVEAGRILFETDLTHKADLATGQAEIHRKQAHHSLIGNIFLVITAVATGLIGHYSKSCSC